MRVITGTAKNGKLDAPIGKNTRPTAERVKEAIFSIIHFDLPESIVLDLFAGSGQLGIEALSRGAKSCVFIDKDKQSNDVITKNVERYKFNSISKIVNGDVISYLKSTSDKYNIVLIDPPYDFDGAAGLLELVGQKLLDDATVIYECARTREFDDSYGVLKKYREYAHGTTKLVVFKNSI